MIMDLSQAASPWEWAVGVLLWAFWCVFMLGAGVILFGFMVESWRMLSKWVKPKDTATASQPSRPGQSDYIAEALKASREITGGNPDSRYTPGQMHNAFFSGAAWGWNYYHSSEILSNLEKDRD